jgi:threonine dehydrogenase-like Zn-dependent dehydrogenase
MLSHSVPSSQRRKSNKAHFARLRLAPHNHQADAPPCRFAIHPIPYPNILGTSYAGTVEAVGDGVEKFQPGDRVATIRTGETLGDPRFGAFQKFALASASSTSKLPSSVVIEDSATAILNLATITSALHIHLGLDLPSLSGSPSPKGKTVLIYGGTSSCGGLAVKYATTAGYRVVTTTSPQHKAYVESLGAESAHIIDHTQGPDALLADIKKQGPYDAIFDTIGIPSVTNLLFDYLGSLGGGSYNTTIPPLGGEKPTPPKVERKFAPYNRAFEEPKNEQLAHWFYEEYVPKGLESGLIIATRPQLVVGGLEKVQHALDLMDQYQVSGHKLILYPGAKPASLSISAV